MLLIFLIFLLLISTVLDILYIFTFTDLILLIL